MNPAQILAESFAILQRGDPRAAEVSLARLWNAGPPPPSRAVHLLGLIRKAQGRFGEAEQLLLQSIAAEPTNAEYHNNLGLLLKQAGFPGPAIESFRAAVRCSPGMLTARLNLARTLDAAGDAKAAETEARAAIAAGGGAEAQIVLGGALRRQGRFDEAIAAFDAALALKPDSVAARHDRAVALDKMGRGGDAIAAFAALRAGGLRAPELFSNWASALMDLGRLEEAETALVEGVRTHPAHVRLHDSLARLRWLRGDTASYTRDFAAAVAAHPLLLPLRIGCADLLRRGERLDEAEAMLRDGLALAPDDPTLAASLGVLLSERGDAAQALPLLERGAAALPGDFSVRENLAAALLQAGRPADALPHIREARAARPTDAAWMAHEAVALRMTGDARYATLYDFERMVVPFDLPTPDGYADFASFNAALADALHGMHRLNAHPIDQSLKNGTQTSKSLLEVDDPVIRAFFASVNTVITDYIARMPDAPGHPFFGRKPKSGRGRIVGCWSVRLRPGGYHVNHVHPEGWISSAYYVAVPPGVAGANDHQGWIQFGEPRHPTPGVTAERFVEPREGRLVLFPSSMWHGTVPFRDGVERLTIAFDVVPD